MHIDRQLALLKFSIEAGILLCGNGVLHAMLVARTHAHTHTHTNTRMLARSLEARPSAFSILSDLPTLSTLLALSYSVRSTLTSSAFPSMLPLWKDYCLAVRSTMPRSFQVLHRFCGSIFLQRVHSVVKSGESSGAFRCCLMGHQYRTCR